MLGLAVALLVAVVLGIAIPAAVERTLLESRREVFSGIVNDLSSSGLIDRAMSSEAEVADLDEAVRDRLLGADVIGVKLWDVSGTVVYSDAEELIGVPFGPSDDVVRAFGGAPVIEHPTAGEADFAAPTGSALIHEYYVPVEDDSGAVVAVFEVYEQADSIDATLSSTRRMVWLSNGFGLAVLLAFFLSVGRASLAVLDGRRRQSESLVAEMARAQETERSRIIGALHDDIGQPLYRVLYGIEGSVSQLEADSPVSEELHRVADLVRWIDGALRSELLMLHQGSIDENDLDTLLRHLVEDVRAESRVDIELSVGWHVPLGEGSRAALFRATREAVTNARKHAGASKIEITVTEGSHRVIVDVEDNGGGFGGDIGMGLNTTRDRLEALGGGLQILAADEGGTLFRAWVPIPRGDSS